MAIVGTLITSAPAASRRSVRRDACAGARVTTMRRPVSGRAANHSSSSAATSPMTITDGAASGCSAIVASDARVVCWLGRVPHRTAATGVWGARPPAIRRSLIRPMLATPIRTTMVPPTRAMAPQSTSDRSFVGSSWPVTIVTDVDEYRRVTGMPAYAGAAIADVMPGTTSAGIPASRSTSSSSAPRAKTKGSPPFRRTTTDALEPCSTSSSLMRSCGVEPSDPRLPT